LACLFTGSEIAEKWKSLPFCVFAPAPLSAIQAAKQAEQRAANRKQMPKIHQNREGWINKNRKKRGNFEGL